MRHVCPNTVIECPYYVRGYCRMMEMTGDNPMEECDEYGFYNEGEEDEDDEDEEE